MKTIYITENSLREKAEEIPVADETTYMPSDNPYIYLKGYANPSNKTKFIVGRGNKKVSFKLSSWGNVEHGYITLFGTTVKGKQIEVQIVFKSLLSLCLGTSVNVVSLLIDGIEKERTTNAKGESINYKIQVSTYTNSGRMKKIQQLAKNELIQLYEEMDDAKKQEVDTLIDEFYDYEVDMAASSKERFDAGMIDGYTDWSGYYEGHGVERLKKALNGFSRSMLFPVGNAKVSNDTLLVNLTSAAECPSNKCGTCFVRGVCYANANANFRFNIRHRDRMLHIANTIWKLTGRWDCLQNLLSEYIVSAKEFGYNIQSIRLNEAGDFIDQETVDNYANVMGNLEDEFGIDVTAYTARTKEKNNGVPIDYSKARELNKAGRPKIIMTVSRADTESVTPAHFNPEDGQVCKTNSLEAADRFFLAIPEKEFNDLTETPVKVNGQPNLMRNMKYSTSINPMGYYHKCQCDIEQGKTCGDCHVCYTPNTLKDENGNPLKYYVFCKIHGSDAGKMTSKEIEDLDKKRGFNPANWKNIGEPAELDIWTPEKDAKLRNSADNGENWQDANVALARANRNSERERDLKKVKLDRAIRPQKTYKANTVTEQITINDIHKMVYECVRHIIR